MLESLLEICIDRVRDVGVFVWLVGLVVCVWECLFECVYVYIYVYAYVYLGSIHQDGYQCINSGAFKLIQ